MVPSFYVGQEAATIRYNKFYVQEDTIGNLLNPKGDQYWFNVEIFGFYYTIFDFNMNVIIFFSTIIAGFTVLFIVSNFIEVYVARTRQFCQTCGKSLKKQKNIRFCSFCGTKAHQKGENMTEKKNDG